VNSRMQARVHKRKDIVIIALGNHFRGDDGVGLENAAVSGSPAGTIHRIEACDGPIPRDLARCSSHGVGLAEAVELVRVLQRLPPRLIVDAVEVGDLHPGAKLTAAVADSARQVVEKLAQEITHLQQHGGIRCTKPR